MLIQQDDSTLNYQMLPDNRLGVGEGAYETPFLDNSLQVDEQMFGVIDPYSDLTNANEVSGYEFATDVSDMDPATAKVQL